LQTLLLSKTESTQVLLSRLLADVLLIMNIFLNPTIGQFLGLSCVALGLWVLGLMRLG